jgi:transcriptional regulator with GAF, ATPase, and Fis domain
MLRESTDCAHDTPALIGECAAIASLHHQIAVAARTQAKVLVLGETGVGKEIVARRIHAQSDRRGRVFAAVNCSGIPETLLESELFGHVRGSFTGAFRDKLGLIEQARGGTLFLDELGEMSLRMQAALLRFTETGEIQRVGRDGAATVSDVRLITATNRDLRAQIAAGAFREDLYYRLNVIEIRVPPLRERGGDVLLLVKHYLRRASLAHALPCPELAPDAADVLGTYTWPGNVRELKNITERLVLRERDRALTADDLAAEIRGGGPQNIVATAPDAVAADETSYSISSAESLGTKPVVPSLIVDELWSRMAAGEDFWHVVHRRFKARELSRATLAELIDRGLTETRGSYRALLQLFNLPESDYKRFHAFLYQQRCNHPVAAYRTMRRSTTVHQRREIA